MPITSKELRTIPRRITRHFVAAIVWMNALFATQFIHIPRIGTSPSLCLDVGLLSFILFYGLICNFGWLSAWFDLLYIYLWPFVLLFKAIYLVGRYFWRKYRTTPSSISGDAPRVDAPKQTDTAEVPSSFVRVFGQFALLWSLICINTNYKALALIAIAAALFGAVRATYNLWDFISDAIDWIESLESPFSRQLAEAIKAIRESGEAEQSQKVKNAANFLKFAEKVCNFIADKKRVFSNITKTVALCITVPFYVYISSVFAGVYMGIARLEQLNLDWRSSLIDSLFVPIAFTDLPHSAAIRLIAGIQAVVIGAMGYNVLFRHFTSRINRLSQTASELGRPLQDRELMSIVELRADKITFLPKPPVSETSAESQSKSIAS